MYAIIETGNKQYKVKAGDTIKVEKLDLSAGDNHVFNNVLVINNNGNLIFGSPTIASATVSATVTAQNKAKKVIVYKFKAKKGYHKKKGHRQPYTELKIESINA
ncbi:MAG: 50S ribosomal protein L21 [Defluviitaleaceae bacterium]|nr:50S ribosomal protein L21 [Defluviitaleaceae bacterium]